jgi:hypothetical protein
MPNDRLPDPERIREFEFPDPRSDFPVPISRELSRKAQWLRGVFTPVDVEIAPENTKFPVFTLLIRECPAETGSHQTALSANESLSLGTLVNSTPLQLQWKRSCDYDLVRGCLKAQ